MCSTDLKRHRYENMSHFKRTPQFEKDLKKLSKKYPSLSNDIADFEQILRVFPTGNGKNFTILHHSEQVKLVKSRLTCTSSRDKSMRIIYAYHSEGIEFVYLELYFKGDKENEDRGRIEEYLAFLGK